MKTIMKMLMMFTIIGAIMFAGVSVGGKAPPEKAKTGVVAAQKVVADSVVDTASPVIVAPAETTTVAIPEKPGEQAGLWDWIKYSSGLLAVVISIVMSLYPTASKWKWLTWILDAIMFILPPNKKVGGGVHYTNLWYLLFGKKE